MGPNSLGLNPMQMQQLMSFLQGGIGNTGAAMGNANMAGTYNDINNMYQQYGNTGTNNLQPMITRLNNQATNFNPQANLNSLQSGYTETPYAKYMTGLATTEAGNEQEMSGMYGSPQGAQDTARIANNIASSDFQNYMQNYMGQQNYGLALNNQAMQGSNDLNQFLAQIMQGRSAAMQGQGASQAASGENWMNDVGDVLGAASLFM